MRKLIFCGLLFALALRSSLSSTTTAASDTLRTSPANGTAQPLVAARDTKTANADTESVTERRQNVTEEHAAVADEGRAAVDSGERETEDGVVPDDYASRVSELYEDLEDSVVFEDSEAGGDTPVASAGGGRLLDGLQHLPIDNGRALVPAAAAVTDDEYSAATASAEEEYDGAAAGGAPEEDAATAGTSPVQRSVRFPEYVRSSSYRRGWPGGNVTRPEELFRFWDPYEFTPAPSISAQCAEHMDQYKEGLRNGNLWAYKSKYLQYCLNVGY